MSQMPKHEPGGNGALTRRERERLRRRRAMLDAAQAVFAEKGYEQATLDEIAERAEFGKGTLYNYFENGKEGILLAVFDEIHNGIYAHVERFAEEARERPLREAYYRFIRRAFGFFLERRELFIVLLKESHRLVFGDDPEQAARFHAREDRLVSALEPALERAAVRGEIRPLPPHPVAHMLIENTKGMLMARAMMDRHQECADSLLHRPDEAAEMLASMLFDGLTPRASSA